SARYDRLEGSLREADVVIQRRVTDAQREGHATPSWGDAAIRLLAQARLSMERWQFDQPWKLLHAARRTEIHGMTDAAERLSVAAAIRAESAKMSGWRREAMNTLLGTPARPEDASPYALFQATAIRDEHYDNQGYKDQLVRTQILALVLILLALLL